MADNSPAFQKDMNRVHEFLDAATVALDQNSYIVNLTTSIRLLLDVVTKMERGEYAAS